MFKFKSMLFTILATCVLTLLTSAIAAQDALQIGALYSCPTTNKYEFKVISCDDKNWCQVFIVNAASPKGGSISGDGRSNILALIKRNECVVPGKAPVVEPKADPAPVALKVKAEDKNVPARNPAQFNVGDRVLASPLFMDGEKYWWACTITDNAHVAENYYKIICDPQGGVSYKSYTVQPKWVKAGVNLPAAPVFDCSFDVPQGKPSNEAGPSAELFKLVVYERMAITEKVRMGVSFTNMQMGQSYKNLVTRNGLMIVGAPQNATIYSIKMQITTCKDGGPEFIERTVYKEKFGCFKDKFGDWVCGDDGLEVTERQNVPKKVLK